MSEIVFKVLSRLRAVRGEERKTNKSMRVNARGRVNARATGSSQHQGQGHSHSATLCLRFFTQIVRKRETQSRC